MKTNRILQKYPRLLLFFLSFALFIGYFLIDKVLFMLFHWEQMPENAFSNCIRVLWNGLPMDISMAGYMMLVPGIIMILSLFFTKGLRAVLTAYFLIICTVVNLIVIPDIGLYSFWGFRIDATIFNYITSPKEALASVSVFFILLVITCIAVWTIIQFYLLKKSAAILFPAQNSNKKALSAVAWILLLGLMVIPMRGGLSTATMNISRVYFSDNIFLNHSAINPVFYMLNSFEQEKSLSSQYRFMSDSEAEDIVTGIIAQTAGNDSVKFIVSEKPNIIFIVLESFGAAIIERLGGERGVAPNLNRLIDEGVFFPNMYANSFRTDRGLVSVFAGFPAQPTMSILKYPQKAQALPSIPQSLINHGYSASFLHGGDLNFANIRSFIVSQGITDITMDKDFPVKELLTKWGARDEVVFRGLLEQIESETKEPYFKAFLTLSSHEPFDVPTVRFDDPYLNSVFYTDSCLGAFVDEMKKRPDWENTLIVMVPDHNMRYPYTIEYFSPERHHIFMLCIGGTVKNPMIVDKICSQTDIASILLSRLSIPDDEFIFSRNVFSPDYNEFAFYDFPNGFGVVTPEGNVAFDCNAGEKLLKWGEVKMETDFNFHTISRVGEEPDSLFVKGKAYLQYLYKVIDGL